MIDRENVTIPVNPRTRRPVGYAFVTVSTADGVDRAISQLSGNKILERNVSIQRARAEETKFPGTGTTTAQEGVSTATSKRMQGYHGDRSVKVEEANEGENLLRETSETISPRDVQAAPVVSWNIVNTTKIRTTLGGSVGKDEDLVDEEPGLARRNRKEIEGEVEVEGDSNRDLGRSILLLVSTVIYSCNITDICLPQLLQWHCKGFSASAFAFLPWIHKTVLYLRTSQRSKTSTMQRLTIITASTFQSTKSSYPLLAQFPGRSHRRKSRVTESGDCACGARSSNA